MTLTHRLALAAMFAGATAFAQTSPSTGSSSSNAPSKQAMPSATAAGKTATGMSASGVLSLIHQVNQDEIRLGKMAESRATNDKVKDFAKMMVEDHTALDKKLTDFVQKEGKGKVTLSASSIPSAKREEMKRMGDDAEHQLKNASAGASYDRSYMSAMVRGHEAALSDVEAALPSLKGQDKIHDLVSDARDKIKDHRDSAVDILKDLDRSTATGGSGTGAAAPSTTGHQAPAGSTTTPSTGTPTTSPSTAPSGGTGR